MNSNKKLKAMTLIYAIYAGGVIIQNILAAKQFDVGLLTVTTGSLASPLVFIAQDIVSELFGYKKAKRLVLTGFGVNFVAVLITCLAIVLPPSTLWNNQEAFASILGSTFKVSVASFIAYIIGSLTNSKIMVGLKKKYGKYLFVRAIGSTAVGQFLDNLIFVVIAFAGVMPVEGLVRTILGVTVFEVLYEVVFYPVTKLCIKKLKGYLK